MINQVSFPGLGLSFTLNRVAIQLFGLPIYWYGVIIVTGLVLAVLFCCRIGKRFGITEDQLIDMMLFAVPAALVSLRAYYVIFNLDLYRRADGTLDWQAIFNLRDGGLAIYGAILSSALVLWLFCRFRKIRFLAYADLGVHGLFLGQSIGRWGNFMNVEAFGSTTTLPWRMCSSSIANYLLDNGYVDADGFQAVVDGTLGVHPTFFYESVWNLAGFFLVWLLGRRRKFDGQCFLFYVFWYGLGRTWIEGLRTDSLYLFGWKLFGIPIRISQLVAFVSALVAGILLLRLSLRFRHAPQKLYVEVLAEEAATKAAADAGPSPAGESLPEDASSPESTQPSRSSPDDPGDGDTSSDTTQKEE